MLTRLQASHLDKNLVGPFYYHRDRKLLRFRVQERHTNAVGYCHGGALSTFVDCALFIIGADYSRTPEQPNRPLYITASLQIHFLSGAARGELLEARGEVLRVNRRDGRLLIRGVATAGQRLVCAFDASIVPAPTSAMSRQRAKL